MKLLVRLTVWRLRRRIAGKHHRLAVATGFALCFFLVLLGGEFYLRWFPPRDFQPYLGDVSGTQGPFRPDEGFAVQYRSWDDFHREYAQRLARYRHLWEQPESSRAWLFFGNSFVQAPGMLGDTAERGLPERTIFYLARNEVLYVRLAQIELLLKQGVRPERIFVVLLPLDFLPLAQHSFSQVVVNRDGAVTYAVRKPEGIVGDLVTSSNLVKAAWIRGKLHQAIPYYSPSNLSYGLEPSMLADVERLFRRLSEVTREFNVPVTVVLVPNYEQITGKATCGLQDQLTSRFQSMGLDVCDVRDPFLNWPTTRKSELFIPDKHFSDLGNALFLDHLLAHLRSIGADPATLDRKVASR